MTVDDLLSAFSEVVDTNRRWVPDWYSWLSKLRVSLATAESDIADIESQIAALVKVAKVSGTLTASATSTVITAATCKPSSIVLACPLTAHAANDFGLMWIAPGTGNFTVNHANNTRVDRTFSFAVVT